MGSSSVSLTDVEKDHIKKNKKTRNKSKDYIDNKEFLQAIVVYQKECRKAKREKREKPPLTPYLGECIYKMASKMTTHRLFYRYSYRDDMAADAMENCVQYFDNFDSTKYTNPFGYFTQIIARAFIRRIGKEEKQKYTTYKHFSETADIAEVDEHFGGDHLKSKALYDNLSHSMRHYEAKEQAKKDRQIMNAKAKASPPKKKKAKAPNKMTRVSTNKGKY
jgi:DNA-directed RNA polymerase specialized sigma24 family protein